MIVSVNCVMKTPEVIAEHARPAITRKEKRAAALKELITAIRNLYNLGARKLAEFCRLFGYRANKREHAARMVVNFYMRNAHPARDRDWVPSELIEAMAVIGFDAFNRAKVAGEAIKAQGVISGVEEAVKQILPKHRQREPRDQGPHISWVHVFSQDAHHRHPYSGYTTSLGC